MLRLILSFFVFLFAEGAFAIMLCANTPVQRIRKIPICQNNMRNIQRTCAKKEKITNQDKHKIKELFNTCFEELRKQIENAENQFTQITGKRVSFYGYVIGKLYIQDIKTYSQLNRFETHLNALHDQLKFHSSQRNNRRESLGARDVVFVNGVLNEARHPHFKNPGFVERYARALAKAIEDSKCDPDNRCIDDLAKQLKEDSKTGPQYYCRKVLQEGQACCSAPNKSCGNFTFAKEITSTFAKSVPGLLSSFAQFRGMQGNPQAACKLSALGNVIAPVGQLQIKSCNKALEGCRETCNKRIKGFKAAFRSCFNINKGDIAKVVRKVKGGLESTDPHYHCKDEIEKIAEAYKKITIEQKISLRDSSDHEDLIACRSGIERYAPSKGRGVLPAQQLAVNICYDRLRRQHPNIPSPPRLPAASPPKGPPLNAGNFAGSVPKTRFIAESARSALTDALLRRNEKAFL